MPNLLALFMWPFLGSLIILFRPASPPKGLALFISLVPVLILAGISSDASFDYLWVKGLNIHFHLKMTPISLLFCYLTALIIPISLLSMKSRDISNPKAFYSLSLILEGLLFGFFMAEDLVFFTLFYEAMLIPAYFIIALLGGPKRQTASLKFLIYMIAGSSLMIAAVLGLYFFAGDAKTFDIDQLANLSKSINLPVWICLAFLAAFAVKTPLFPFHGWLPDAYVQSPVGGSIQLSALLSKAGIYGIVRIVLEMFPSHMEVLNPWLLAVSIIGVLYGGLAALVQNDFKRLIAYSSFSHVNFILAGLFVTTTAAKSGAVLQALNHGITIAALFLVAGWLESRLHSTAIGLSSGLTKFMPYLSWLTLFFVLSSVALPGTNNFIGELFILFGIFGQYPIAAFILGLSVILSVAYSLRWMQKVYYEAPSYFQEQFVDLRLKEALIAFPLIVLVLGIGLYPTPLLAFITNWR